MNRNVIEGPYLNDILGQPAALRRAWEGLEETEGLGRIADRLTAGGYRRIVLTGMGSSLYALYPLHLKLVAAGMLSQWTETAELIHYQSRTLAPDSLVIAVSQSGRSAEILTLVNSLRGRADLFAVTNTPDSPFALGAGAVLEMRAGPEATVACKTYVTTLLVLEWLAAVLTGGDPDAARERLRVAPDAAAEYLHQWEKHVEALEHILAPVRRIFVTGRGPSMAAAEAGGLILKESMHFAAEGMSGAAFRHGPYEVLDRDVLVVAMEGDEQAAPFNHRLVADARSTGGLAALAGPGGEGPFCLPDAGDAIRPILESVPVQMITLALGSLQGRQPGKFERATKVTTVE